MWQNMYVFFLKLLFISDFKIYIIFSVSFVNKEIELLS